MMTSSNENIFRVTGHLCGQGPVTRSFDVFFDLRLNKRLSKQSWGWWIETPSCPLWRHCDEGRSSSVAITCNIFRVTLVVLCEVNTPVIQEIPPPPPPPPHTHTHTHTHTKRGRRGGVHGVNFYPNRSILSAGWILTQTRVSNFHKNDPKTVVKFESFTNSTKKLFVAIAVFRLFYDQQTISTQREQLNRNHHGASFIKRGCLKWGHSYVITNRMCWMLSVTARQSAWQPSDNDECDKFRSRSVIWINNLMHDTNVWNWLINY